MGSLICCWLTGKSQGSSRANSQAHSGPDGAKLGAAARVEPSQLSGPGVKWLNDRVNSWNLNSLLPHYFSSLQIFTSKCKVCRHCVCKQVKPPRTRMRCEMKWDVPKMAMDFASSKKEEWRIITMMIMQICIRVNARQTLTKSLKLSH